MSTKSKIKWFFWRFLQWNSENFDLLVINNFLRVRACFSGISIWPFFSAVVKDINFKRSKNKLPVQTLIFSSLKFLSRSIDTVKFWKISLKNFKKSQKSYKNSKNEFVLGIYNSRLKAKILTEMIRKHYFIYSFITRNKFERSQEPAMWWASPVAVATW